MEKAPKRRHSCLNAFLALMILGNALLFLAYVLGSASPELEELYPRWVPIILGFLSLFNVIFAVGLLRLKKWAFWGIVINTVIMFIFNLYLGIEFSKALIGLLLILALYGILHIGKEDKGWPQLD